jgi:hypothetical protein
MGVDVNTPGVADKPSTMVRSQYLVIFLTSSFRVDSLFTSMRRSSRTPSMPGRHSSNTLSMDSKASRQVAKDAIVESRDAAVESSLCSSPSKRFSWVAKRLSSLARSAF